MRHSERMQLAKDLCLRMVATYPNDILLGGVYGSTARGTDTLWSDLDMMFVVREKNPIKGKHFVYRNTAVGYRVIGEQRLRELLAHPSLDAGCNWSLWMGLLSVLQVLYGNPAQVRSWLQLGQSVPVERFREALEESLQGLVVESYGRILSCRERGNTRDIGCAVLEVLFQMNEALCLLNRRWVTHDYYQGLVDAFDFPKLPERYQELVPALWSARDVEKIVALAETLVHNFWRLLAEEGIKARDYQHVSELPL